MRVPARRDRAIAFKHKPCRRFVQRPQPCFQKRYQSELGFHPRTSESEIRNPADTDVIQALTQRNGIDPKRLAPFGNGPYAPVATNDSEEGRAKNRRVELVKHL